MDQGAVGSIGLRLDRCVLGARDRGFGGGEVHRGGRIGVDRADQADEPAEAGSLDDHGDQDDGEGRDQHQVAARHLRRQGQRHRQRDHAAHAGPRQHARLPPAERAGAAKPAPTAGPRAARRCRTPRRSGRAAPPARRRAPAAPWSVRTASTPTRSSTPRSEKPIRMNTRASRPNTRVRQKAVPCIRTLAGKDDMLVPAEDDAGRDRRDHAGDVQQPLRPGRRPSRAGWRWRRSGSRRSCGA